MLITLDMHKECSFECRSIDSNTLEYSQSVWREKPRIHSNSGKPAKFHRLSFELQQCNDYEWQTTRKCCFCAIVMPFHSVVSTHKLISHRFFCKSSFYCRWRFSIFVRTFRLVFFYLKRHNKATDVSCSVIDVMYSMCCLVVVVPSIYTHRMQIQTKP